MENEDGLVLSNENLNDDFILKHVNAIALMPVVGGRKISLFGRRLFNILIHYSMENPDREEHSAGLTEIAEISEFSSKDLEQIKRTLRELMTTTVEWQSPAQNELIETWDACNLLGGVGFVKNKKSGAVTINWRFDMKVRENILKPGIYARLSLDSITKFSTHGAMVLYEICARYARNPSHLTTRRDWREWWLPILTGTSKDNKKKEYRFFKRDILKKAIAEVNEKSNLIVTGPIEFKGSDGKTINDIQFKVYYKDMECQTPPLINTTEEELPIIGRAINLGIKQSDIEKLLTHYSILQIVEALNELEKRNNMLFNSIGEIKNVTAWLKTVLKNTSEKRIKSPIKKSKPSDLKGQREKWEKEWLQIQKDNLLYSFQDCSDEEKSEIEKAFGSYLNESEKQILFDNYTKYVKLNALSKPNVVRKYLWEYKILFSAFISFLGVSQRGVNWDKPTAEDLLVVAAKELAKQ